MREIIRINGKSILLLAFLCLFFAASTIAQEKRITGTVYDSSDGTALPGATVVVKGTSIGTTSDIDGVFNINTSENSTLIVSFIGYVTQEVALSGETSVKIDLAPDFAELSEVVVVGYGTQKKIELTGAVSSIKSEEMSQIVSSDFTKSLQGKIAGVSVVESSGRPGDQANIQIRGLGSISSDSGPLYVVDGIPYNGNPNLASEDIETVDILKDGASAAVYGTRASNGVILITTKRGKEGKTKVSFSSYYGIQNITSGTELLNTAEHLYVDEQMQVMQGSHSSILHYNPNAMDYDTDFVGAITNDNASVQSHNVSFSGGRDGITFNVNTNYFNQDGILRQSGYDRFTTRANASLKKGKFDAFVSIAMMHSNKEQEPWGLYEFAMFQGPYRQPLGSLETTTNSVIIPGNNPDHVGYLSKLLKQKDDRIEDSYNLAANLKYEITKGLTYQVNLGMNHWNYHREFWQPQYLVYDEDGAINKLGSREDAILTEDFSSSNKYTMENLLNYTKTFDKHTFSALVGYTVEKTIKDNVSTQKRDFISNDVSVFDGGASNTAITGNDSEHGIVGKLARLQYNYDDRYLFSASVRYDGSSNFGEDNRYKEFYGASAGWNISEEKFMESVTSIDNLKLRLSYGEVGNQGISPYLYAAYVDANIDYVWGPESGDELGSGAIQRGYGNPMVQWETNISQNIGVDLLMFDGKFSLTADVYKNDKQDMLLNVLLPASSGTTITGDWGNYNSITSNVGNMVNKGFEIGTYYKERTSFGMNWQVSGTFTRNINEITDLGEDLEKIALADSKPGSWRATQQDMTTYMVPGYEAGAFFLIPTDGIFKTAEQLAAHVHTNEDGSTSAIQPNAQLGDLIYIDTDKNGVIDDDDRTYQGSGQAKFEVGLNLTVDYKGFDLSTQLFYSNGNKVFNGAKLFAYSMGRHKDLARMWTPQNPDSDIMSSRSSSEHDNFRSRSNYFLEDADFLRVRNITLGYTLPKKITGKYFDKLRVYCTAQNAFTFTNYDGYDPEVGGNGVSTRGIDKGSYPVTRKFLMGVQVDF
ncbi:SusC/RagA family TonB-linked outer membrane protein [Labilibaculum antarcticum]|uniref:SusC/RagA family TonB-linked outer membrane protein n=1 Tax=Labilibaculum antarcticum TaxID=1717717 RepID=A0A1Y1CF07_9BACT|nr:TonB-dependent receptor [Labilibaculum antarcticum]BAX78947.1 SusC/RagA family TonB-linked outer membrane protein [Labilibaculum antarcticum]